MEIISLGAGVQSSALVILNTIGEVKPKASHAVFADTGGEFDSTLEMVDRLREWSEQNGGPTVTTVRRDDHGLHDWHYARTENQKATPLCMRAEPSGALWKRDCTIRWKIKPIEKWLKSHHHAHQYGAIVQLGITLDETHRIRPSKTSWITNRWPLVELKMSRADCFSVFKEAGLPPPQKSACWFCPMRPVSYWAALAASDCERFEKAAQLEDRINVWNAERGKEPTYLSSRHKPLRQAFSTDQMWLLDEIDDDECGGYCFT